MARPYTSKVKANVVQIQLWLVEALLLPHFIYVVATSQSDA